VLLVDYLGTDAVYCGPESGCLAVKAVANQWFSALPVPLLGLFGFSLLLVLSFFFDRKSARLWLRVLSGGAAFCGLSLLVVQAWVLRRFCPSCVVVDLLAITTSVGVLIADRADRTSKKVEGPLRPLVALTYLGIACVTPFLWPQFRPAASVPKPLLRFQKPDRTTLLEFVDLQCPYCVALYPTLEQLRREYGNTVFIQRIHVPQDGHDTALKAARLLACLKSPKEVDVVERVFFETQKLTELTFREAALSAGFTTSSMEACLADEASARLVRGNRELFRGLGHLGLPTVFVGGERIIGAQPRIAYQAAIFKARRSSSRSKSEALAFWGIVLMLMVTVYAMGQRELDRGV
jgi:predicted DsbA family dithiol-disulfide isomerase/uncharacterized membrane protein